MAGSIKSLKSSRLTLSSDRVSDLVTPFTNEIKNTHYKNIVTDATIFQKTSGFSLFTQCKYALYMPGFSP